MAQLFKRRCGVGVDLSNLRPNGAQVSNSAGTTTGAVSFMDRFSNTTREVAQNGRRGALMLTMDVAHPDIEDFITDLCKIGKMEKKGNAVFVEVVKSSKPRFSIVGILVKFSI